MTLCTRVGYLFVYPGTHHVVQRIIRPGRGPEVSGGVRVRVLVSRGVPYLLLVGSDWLVKDPKTGRYPTC